MNTIHLCGDSLSAATVPVRLSDSITNMKSDDVSVESFLYPFFIFIESIELFRIILTKVPYSFLKEGHDIVNLQEGDTLSGYTHLVISMMDDYYLKATLETH